MQQQQDRYQLCASKEESKQAAGTRNLPLGGAVLEQRLAEVKELQLMRSRCSKTTRAPVVVHSQNAVVADIAAGPAPAEMVPQYFKQQQQLVIGILVFRAASTIVTAFA
jgi:hypothetical protein